jgi:hypothetical protein
VHAVAAAGAERKLDAHQRDDGVLPVKPWIAVVAMVTLVAASSAGPNARAAGPADANDETERQRSALYAEGVSLANAGQWEEAVSRFRQVVAIRSAPPALFTLAQAEEHLGRLATAERDYENALASARAAGQPEVSEAAARALSGLALRVPWIVVRLARALPAAVATVDGTNVSFGQPVKLDPGAHVVAAQAPDHRPFEKRVDLAAGQSVEVPVSLEPIVPPSPPPPPLLPGTEQRAPPPPEPLRKPLPLGPGRLRRREQPVPERRLPDPSSRRRGQRRPDADDRRHDPSRPRRRHDRRGGRLLADAFGAPGPRHRLGRRALLTVRLNRGS